MTMDLMIRHFLRLSLASAGIPPKNLNTVNTMGALPEGGGGPGGYPSCQNPKTESGRRRPGPGAGARAPHQVQTKSVEPSSSASLHKKKNISSTPPGAGSRT